MTNKKCLFILIFHVGFSAVFLCGICRIKMGISGGYIPQFQTFKELFETRNSFFGILDNNKFDLALDLAEEVLNVVS